MSFCARLRLKRNATITSLNPIGESQGLRTRASVRITFSPHGAHNAEYRLTIHSFVMNRITAILPINHLDIGEWPIEVTNGLADPTLREPGQIDVLLGAHVWSRIAMASIHRNDETGLIVQRMRIGWLIFGGLISLDEPLVGAICAEDTEEHRLNAALQRIFQLENLARKSERSQEEQDCEDVFTKHIRRKPDGRYVAPMPLKSDAPALGNSRRAAYRRYLQLERKFKADPTFRNQYVAFMQDYIEKGHMSLLKTPLKPDEPHYFIPHHGIDNGKFRTVFDGSAVTSSGQSLNDVQMLGERLLDNLCDIILRFRLHAIALTADVTQMYRQIEIDESHRKFQLIFWRPPEAPEPMIYQLNSV